MGVVGRSIPLPVKLARRLLEYHKLTVPFNLEELVKKHATLVYKTIPMTGIDGVTINLKVPGKVPKVVVNSNMPKTRQKFTLAHELGHIIIPSHTGTIVDEIYTQDALNWQYYFLEQEANVFAAELLMPTQWVEEMYRKHSDNLEYLHFQIASIAGVSDQAAAIRLIQILPPEIAFVAVEHGEIVNNGRTELSTLRLQDRGSDFDSEHFKHVKHHSIYHSGLVLYHWYDLNAKTELRVSHDTRTWREILDSILSTTIPLPDREQLRRSINGVASAANSTAQRNPNYSVEFLIVAITNRFQNRGDEFEKIVNHPDYETFVHKRAYDFFHKIKK